MIKRTTKLITKRGFMLAFMGLLGLSQVFGQPLYTRSIFSSAYTPISIGGGATESPATGDDVDQLAIPIGFTFNYAGIIYTSISLNTNGLVWFDAASPGATNGRTNTNLFLTTTPNQGLSAYWDDLTDDATSSILYQTQGSAGSQTFTIQYTDYPHYFSGGTTTRLNFQVILYETSNIIEFRYGPVTGTGVISVSSSASIGLEWGAGGAGNFIDAVTGLNTSAGYAAMNCNRVPAYNYRFIPGTPAAISGGTYNVGVSQTYPSLTEAVAELNHRGITGPVTMNLTDSDYDTTAANGNNIFPLVIGLVPGASSPGDVIISKSGSPANIWSRGTAATPTIINQANATAITNTSEPVIAVCGNYITLQNVHLRTHGTPSPQHIDRGLVVFNRSASGGAQFNSFFDIFITLDRSTTNATRTGISQIVATTPSSAAGANSNNQYRNLDIKNVYRGIQLTGNATFPDDGCVIGTTSCTVFNNIGDAGTPQDIGGGASSTQLSGITATNQSNLQVYNNKVNNVSCSGAVADGIFIESFFGTSSVFNNIINGVRNNSTTSTTTASGIRMTHPTSGSHTLRVYNNAILNITSAYTGTITSTRGIRGINVSGTGGVTSIVYDIWNNSVAIDHTSNPNISSSCYEIATTSGPVFNVSNNIFGNYTNSQSGLSRHFGIRSTSATALGNTGSLYQNNNIFIANQAGTNGFTAQGNTTDYNGIATWEGANTQATGNLAIDPQFTSVTADLKVNNLALNNTGVPLPGYLTNDLDCNPRTDNDPGAYNITACSGTPSGGTASASVNPVCQGSPTSLSLTGHSTGSGITYKWKTGAVSGGPYTDITGATSSPYSYSPASAGTEYIICEVTCNVSGLSANSSEITLTVNPSPSSTATGPSSGLTYQNLNYSVTGYPIGSTFQWQASTTSCAAGFTNISGATSDNLVAVANAGATFYIRCMVTFAGCSAPSNCITTVVAVAGDNVCSAIPLSLGNNGPFTNSGATGEVGEVVPPTTACVSQTGWCNNTGTINSVWFTFTPPASGRYSFRLNPNLVLWDSQFAIYSASSCSPFAGFSLIAANDDSTGSPFQSYISPVCLEAGQTYYFLVDGYNATVNTNWGILVTQVSTLSASISGSSSICLSNSAVVTLNFTGTAPFSYTVTGSGGPYNGTAPSATENVTVIPAAGGVQNYTITAFGDASCPVGGAGTGTATVNVSTAPPAGTIGSVSASASACAGSVQLITAAHAVTGSFIQFSWNTGTSSSTVLFSDNIGGPFVAGPFLTSTNSVYAQFGALGASSSGYNICVQAINGCGSSNNKCTFIRGTVTVPAGITGPAVQCSGATGQLYSVTGPLPVGVETFVWSFSVGGAVITPIDPPLNSQVSIDFPAFTTGTLSVQAALSCLGSSVSAARNLALSNATATPAVPTGPNKVCPGSSYNYSVPAVPGATTYNWTVPANASITAGAGTNSITVSFNATPINFVNGIVSVNTSSACAATSGTTSKTVSSMVPSTPSTISGQTTGVCNAPFNYSVTAVSGVTYNWSLPSGASGSSTSNIINVTFSNSYVTGTISVTGTAAGCAVASSPRSLNVSGVPATPASITALFPPCNGGPGQFQTGTVFGATSYTWTVPANGTTLDAGQGTTTIDVTWGTGNGNLTVKANNACGSSGLRTLYYVPGCRLAGEEAASISSLTVYPNPAHTQATIAFKAAKQGSYSITMTDVTGRTVRNIITNAEAGVHQLDVNLNDLAKGMYLIELRSNSGTEVQKLMVE